jgi:WD40 repeat protein
VRGLMFHPSGKYLISCSDDKTWRVWDLKQGKYPFVFYRIITEIWILGRAIKTVNDAHAHFVSCLDFNSSNPHLVTGGVDDVIKIWGCRYQLLYSIHIVNVVNLNYVIDYNAISPFTERDDIKVKAKFCVGVLFSQRVHNY